MSGYLGQSQESEQLDKVIIPDGPLSSLKHPTDLEKFENAARRVVDQPNPFTRHMLAGIMGIELSQEPIRSLLELPAGDRANFSQKIQLIRIARQHGLEGEILLEMGYNALADIGPEEDNIDFIDPAVIELDPGYDLRSLGLSSLEASIHTPDNNG